MSIDCDSRMSSALGELLMMAVGRRAVAADVRDIFEAVLQAERTVGCPGIRRLVDPPVLLAENEFSPDTTMLQADFSPISTMFWQKKLCSN